LTDKIIDGLFDGYMSNSPKEMLTDKKLIDGMTYGFSIGDMLYSSMEILMK
jgi:hypothetical protein